MPITPPAPIDYNIQQTNPLNSLGSMLNIANSAQHLQSGNIQLQQQKQANIERQNMMQIMPQLLQADGTIDYTSPENAKALVTAAPMGYADYQQKFADSNQKTADANKSILGLSEAQQGYVAQALPALKGQSAANVMSSLADLAEQTPGVAPFVSQLNRQIGTAVQNGNGDPKATQDAIDKVLDFNGKRTLTLIGQKDLLTPSYVNTGGKQVNQNPFTPNAPSLTNTLSPQVILDANGQPHYVGGGNGAPSASGGHSGTGLNGGGWATPANVEAQKNATTDMSNHFAGLNASAQSLPLTTALTKTIESLSPSAFTGVGGDKKQYMSGLLRSFSLDATGDAQTDTNLLNKAIAQLNISSPAGTDAARQLVEAGQPNSKMDATAIKEAAGTVAGQVKMNAAERNFLQTARYSNQGTGDVNTYQEGRQKFEANADPRIWQYEELAKTNPKAANAFINRQPDKSVLVKKAGALEGMGFFK
jgi:hypothetical protein